MSVSDFFDYLLGRDDTRELALELAYVYEIRRPPVEWAKGVR